MGQLFISYKVLNIFTLQIRMHSSILFQAIAGIHGIFDQVAAAIRLCAMILCPHFIAVILVLLQAWKYLIYLYCCV